MLPIKSKVRSSAISINMFVDITLSPYFDAMFYGNTDYYESLPTAVFMLLNIFFGGKNLGLFPASRCLLLMAGFSFSTFYTSKHSSPCSHVMKSKDVEEPVVLLP